jgi:hypothetical protein
LLAESSWEADSHLLAERFREAGSYLLAERSREAGGCHWCEVEEGNARRHEAAVWLGEGQVHATWLCLTSALSCKTTKWWWWLLIT